MRTATIDRKTGETDIHLTLALDGRGKADVTTGIGFLDHMLTLFAHHGLFDLTVQAAGDLHVDAYHTVEDVAICLGQALDRALGDRAASSARRTATCRWTRRWASSRWTSAAGPTR